VRERLSIATEAGPEIHAVRYADGDGSPTLVLAHGAGAGQESAFMVAFSEAMRTRGVAVVTFDFPYIQRRSRAPDRPPVLESTWRSVVASLLDRAPGRLFIGGKSMGGRIASQVLAEPLRLPGVGPKVDLRARVAGLVLLGYPLHPPNQPERLRTAHLPAILTPVLVVQGERDEFGTEDEVRLAFRSVPAPVDWLIVPGGDHSFRAGRRETGPATLEPIADRVAGWIHARAGASPSE
jgi:uncharacterized protein